jgi:PAS domain S-box-containing protein
MSTKTIADREGFGGHREEASDALLEPLYRTVFETTGTATVVIEEDTTISRVNQGFEELTGYCRAEVEGIKSWKEFVEKARLNELLRYHRARRDGDCTFPGSHEFRILTRAGEERDVYATIAMIPGTRKSVASLLDITARKEMEKALGESEEKFRLLFEKSAYPALLLDGEVFVDCNEAACGFLGLSSKEQLVGRTPVDISPEKQPDGRSSRSEAGELHDISLKEGAHRFEWTHRDVHGRDLCTEVCVTIVPINGKPMTHVLWKDITASKQAQARLRESEERYRIAIEHSNDGVLIAKGESRVYANQRLLDMFGYHATGEIGSESFLSMVHPGDRMRVADYISRRQRGDEAPARYEFEGIRKDGTTIHIEVSVAAIRYRGERLSLAYLRDVTEKRLAEAELRRSEEKFRKIFENTMEAIFQSSAEGGFFSANPALARMLGYESPEELMKNVTDIGSQVYAVPQDRESIKALVEQYDAVRNVEAELLHKSGRRIWASIDLNAIRDSEGKVLHYEGTFVDITERKLAEEALRRREKELEAKSTSLEEANTALKVLLRRREEDRKALEDRIATNVKEMVFPYIEKLKGTRLGENQSVYLSIMESGLNDIVSPLIEKMTASYAHFTPMEIQVATLAKAGKTSKESSRLLGLSKRTIDTHKNNIRKKLNLSNRKINLQAYLQNISCTE